MCCEKLGKTPNVNDFTHLYTISNALSSFGAMTSLTIFRSRQIMGLGAYAALRSPLTE